MPISVLPLNEMSVEEKLETMETIWASLSANPEAIESPAWHEEELREREAREQLREWLENFLEDQCWVLAVRAS